jgi:hypothetical protein
MCNALTLLDMLPGLQEVVVRDVAARHLGGRAVCGKSARTDLVRGRDRVTARPTLQRHFSAGPSGSQPLKTPLGHADVARRRPLLARGAGGIPSTQRRPAAAARSKAWRGNTRPGQANQDGLRWKLSGAVGKAANLVG